MPERLLAVALICLLVAGCSGVSYLGQAARGQFALLWQRQPIDALLRDPDTDEELAQRLRLVLEIREFASSEIGLPDNDSYRYYADLERRYASWVVFAAGEFSVQPQNWCFPVAGCVNYRGYFERAGAEQFADRLRQRGLDTFVAGVPAYSTLGWFADPLLNTVVELPEEQLAGLIFHELAHQRIYLPGDTPFNESLAMAVELEAVKRWLLQRGEMARLHVYQHHIDRRMALLAAVSELRTELAQLYASGLPDHERRRLKRQLFQTFSQRHSPTLGEGVPPAPVLNNAWLVSLSSYYQWLPAFQALLRGCDGDWPEFFRRAEQLAGLEAAQRRHRLRSLAAKFEK